MAEAALDNRCGFLLGWSPMQTIPRPLATELPSFSGPASLALGRSGSAVWQSRVSYQDVLPTPF